MRHSLLLATILATLAGPASAALIDLIGGPDESTQTVHHCGYLPTLPHAIYTGTPVTTRIVQQKLRKLGYYHAAIDGKPGRATKAALRTFQSESRLAADGIAGPATAQRLAYEAHPSSNVHRCWREAPSNFPG